MELELKDDEILIFTDFNNTLVDYANEYNFKSEFIEDFDMYLARLKCDISNALNNFAKKTGLKPVICIVTNASLTSVDGNGYNGLCGDLKMTFFNHEGQTDEKKKNIINNSCEQYIKYVIHKENDGLLKINPYGNSMDEMFIPIMFSDEAMKIKHKDIKRESVERFMCDFGNIKNKFFIFAGDSIEDDYPMKYGVNKNGVYKIFIRPGKVTKMKESIMYQFCKAKGVIFDCVNPRNNKKIKNIDANNLKFLNDSQVRMLFDYDDGDAILLTSPNSKGFIEGIKQSIDIVNKLNSPRENSKHF